MNLAAVDHDAGNLYEVNVPDAVTSTMPLMLPVPNVRPGIRPATYSAQMIAQQGDDLPVSALPIDGTYPTGTTQWEKRNLALEIPVWDPNICIQCGKCAMVCPHAVIRIKVAEPEVLADAPATLQDGTCPRYRMARACSTSSRSRRKTARAAASASTSARPRTSRQPT